MNCGCGDGCSRVASDQSPKSSLDAQEESTVKQLIAMRAREGFYRAVSPGTALDDGQHFKGSFVKPTANCLGHEVRGIITANVFGFLAYGEQVLENTHHVLSGKRTTNFYREAFLGVLVEYYQKTQLATVVSPILHKVVRPHMILVLSTVTNANHSHFRLEIVACDVFFVGSADVLTSKVDGRVSRSLSSLAASATHKCVPIRNEVVDEPVNESRAVRLVTRSPDVSDIAGYYVVDPEHGRHDAVRLFLLPNGYAR